MSLLSLINWRREIFSIYDEVRSEEDGILAWNKWKDKRENLFKFHPESPTFDPKKQSGFNDVPVLYSYNQKFSLFSKFEQISNSEIIQLNTDENSITRLKPFIKTTNLIDFLGIELTVFKIEGYGGGLFLPFTDSGCKSGGTHYEGGRYLIDTVKGADLGELKTDE